jgi:glycosyltransferase involved in cell wall biosynthesis
MAAGNGTSALAHASLTAPFGVSIVVCCFNSASRLSEAFGQTLAHLAAQDITTETPWEVIVVDNASTDDTAQIAQMSWPRGIAGSLQVVREPQLGLSYARERGLAEAKYEFVSFVDDDNWVFPGWVDTVAEVMSQHPQAAACGGHLEPVFEILPPPVWFERFKGWFAVGPDLAKECDVTDSRGVLWGAGLTIRRSAWKELRSNGFHFLLADRQGAALSDSGDDEFCLALRLLSWRLWYAPRLLLRHFMPAQRLEWRHLRRRARADGVSSVVLDAYYLVLRELEPDRSLSSNVLNCLRAKWPCQAMIEVVKTLIKRPIASLFLPVFAFEGRAAALGAEMSMGRLARLLEMRATYDLTVKRLRDLAGTAHTPIRLR